MPTLRREFTREDARRFIADGCLAPTERPLIGLELEFLSFTTSDAGRPSVEALQEIADGALPSGGRVTCEPGGQLEVSPPPSATAGEAIAVATADIAALRNRAAAADIELLAVGADRWREPERVVDSTRYRTMEAYFDGLGRDGRRMMCNTAALQVNIGVPASRPEDTWRAAHAIGPALIAAFANSPDESGCKSTRMRTWMAMDPTRTAPVPHDAPLPDAWVDYAMAAPTLVARDRDGACIALPEPIPFTDWLDRGCAIGFPTEVDLAYHLTMLFPPVRPRQWLEIRYLDALPSPWWEVAATVTAALLNEATIDDALAASAGTESLWHAAADHGLDDERLAQAADRCFAVALAATGDAGVADYLERYVARRVPAWA